MDVFQYCGVIILNSQCYIKYQYLSVKTILFAFI